MSDFVVVLAAESDVWFLPESGPWEIIGFPSPVGPVDVKIDTRFADEGYSSWVPREMWIEARGTAEADLRDVIVAYANAAAGFLPTIAFAANAYIGDLQPKLGYDATEGSTQRAFFQSFVREERGTVPRPGRWVDVPSTMALFEAVAGHHRSDRLQRAIAQYALALGHWQFGHETLAVAHLYMAAEALTPIALGAELDRVHASRETLAADWGIELKRLDAEVRRRLIFHGDDEAFEAARKASDGFEHSFLDFELARDLSRQVRDSASVHIRSSVIELAGLTDPARAALLAPPRDTPIRSFLTRYVWGEIIGDVEPISLPGEEYPALRWESRLKGFERDGRILRVEPEESMGVRIAKGLTLRITSVEAFGPYGIKYTPGGSNLKVTRAATGIVEEVAFKDPVEQPDGDGAA
jgi:hypothetical protein